MGAALAVCAVGIGWYGTVVYAELSRKPVYAGLQYIDARYRDRHLTLPAKATGTNAVRAVAIGTGDDRDPYVWIVPTLTDAASVDGTFRLGNVVRKTTPCATLRPILANPATQPAAARYLRHNCRP
ncbi:hypothetical protein [Sphingomonas sp. Leaf25]|uniref:hypothetical protein n=1 Tax=Sphingomonas sp. Leaf25 TaxID=1735692 RepID=UPI0012E292FD|nr:hypothetical protein [Sphingomonas sp. Leaf25]